MRSYYKVAPLMVAGTLLSCGNDLNSLDTNIGYNGGTASTLESTPWCDACLMIETPAPQPQPNPNPNPNPTPTPAKDAHVIDAIIDAQVLDASWEPMCLAYGFPGDNGPVCRRTNTQTNEINEGGILGCDKYMAPCCIDPDAFYSSNLPSDACVQGNWAPGFPKSVPENRIGQCVRLETVVRDTCQAYVYDANNQVTVIEGGKLSCDNLGGPCCYVEPAQLPENTTLIPPTCQNPNTVTWVNESDLQ